MNESGNGFMNIGFVAGVASEADSRNVINDDLDGDGRRDLLVSQLHNTNAGRKQKLSVYANRSLDDNYWIGVRLGKAPYSGIGATVAVHTADRIHLSPIVTGDSHASQHSPDAHFGLGQTSSVEKIEIRWPNGRTDTIDAPAVNQYHSFP